MRLSLLYTGFIPESIKIIYKLVLVHKRRLKSGKDKTKIYEYNEKRPTSFFKRLIEKPIKEHIIFPTDEVINDVEPNKGLADSQKTLYRVFDKLPTCKICSKFINYGYERCEAHMLVCDFCKKKEIKMFINGKGTCLSWRCNIED